MVLRTVFSEGPQIFSLKEQVVEYRTQYMRMKEFNPVKQHYDNEILFGTHNGVKTVMVK